MSKVVYKAFPLWDWEKEAAWLNEMSRQGWQLCRVGWCRYEFEQGEPGRWQYQLEMLQKTTRITSPFWRTRASRW